MAHALHNMVEDSCGGHKFTQDKNGRVKLCSKLYPAPSGPDLLKYIRNVSFVSKSILQSKLRHVRTIIIRKAYESTTPSGSVHLWVCVAMDEKTFFRKKKLFSLFDRCKSSDVTLPSSLFPFTFTRLLSHKVTFLCHFSLSIRLNGKQNPLSSIWHC